jgi:hypothetical protein
MRPDFIPPGQEAAHGIGKTGRYQDYVPGPLPDDLPVDQGGTGLAVPPDLLAPVPAPSPEAIAVPDAGPPASAIMSPGPMAEEPLLAPGSSLLVGEELEPSPPGARSQEPGAGLMVGPPADAAAAAQPAAAQPLMVPPPEVEPAPPKLTKAEREAIAAKAVEEARRLQEEADRHDEEDVPEAGQKGGQSKSPPKAKGK